MRLIGINGGTFDPIHYGHLRPALEAMQLLQMAEVQFVPCFQPVHKGQPQVSAAQRCQMIERAIEAQPQFVLNKIEIEQGGPSYMVQTLKALKPDFANEALVLMMGTDAFAKFCSWHQWQRILALSNILIMHRPGVNVLSDAAQQGASLSNEESLWLQRKVESFTCDHGQIMELAVTQLDISSTQIRQYLQSGMGVDYLTPQSVVQYMQQNQLYQPDLLQNQGA